MKRRGQTILELMIILAALVVVIKVVDRHTGGKVKAAIDAFVESSEGLVGPGVDQ